MRTASLEALAAVPGISVRDAQAIHDFFGALARLAAESDSAPLADAQDDRNIGDRGEPLLEADGD